MDQSQSNQQEQTPVQTSPPPAQPSSSSPAHSGGGNKMMFIFLGIVAIAIIVGGIIFLNASSAPSTSQTVDQQPDTGAPEGEEAMQNTAAGGTDSAMAGDSMMKDDAMMEEDEAMDSKDAMMEKDQAMEGDSMTITPGEYTDYSEAALTQATANGGKAVIFFHASWCPTCRATEEAFIENASEIPAGTTVLKVDYDSADALKQQYGITSQHTFVQVDETGAEITKWNGGDIAELQQNVL